jgi:P2-related tail formation protein
MEAVEKVENITNLDETILNLIVENMSAFNMIFETYIRINDNTVENSLITELMELLKKRKEKERFKNIFCN